MLNAATNLPIPANDDDAGAAPKGPLPRLLALARDFIDEKGGGEGYYETAMSGVHVLCSLHRVMANHTLYRPSLCIVLQGAKQILVGEETLDYGVMQCLVVNIELPACGRIVEASPGVPFVGITIDFDVPAMRQVLEEMDMKPEPDAEAGSSIFVAEVDEPLADCVMRLVRLNRTPRAIPVVYPSIMREIYYWLLAGPHGPQIRRLAMPDTRMDRVADAIRILRDNYTGPIRIDDLAGSARMSPSSFHHHFKALTAMTPLQFQKQLRLLEARRRMVNDGVGVSQAAYDVGYESASQFSREYSRMFGTAPKRDVARLRAEPA